MFRTTLFAMVLFWIPFAALKSARKDRRHSMLYSLGSRPLDLAGPPLSPTAALSMDANRLSAIRIPNQEGWQRDESFLVSLLSSRAINGGAFFNLFSKAS